MLTLTSLLTASAAAVVATAPAPPPAAPRAEAALARLSDEARSRNPGVEAARLRWEAARRRVAGEGLLPDPLLGASLMSLSTLQGPQLTAAQTFPLGGRLGLARSLAEQEAEVARLAYLAEQNRTLAALAAAYHEARYLRRAGAIVARTKDLMARMSRIAAAKYAVGTGKQGDPLRANVQLAEMLHEGLLLRQRRDANLARLGGLLGRPPGEAVDLGGELQLGEALPAAPRLAAALAAAEAHNPMLGEARAMVAAGELALAAAATTATPELSAQLGVGRAYMDQGWMTALSGMVGVNVPFPHGQARQEAALGSAEAELAARRATLEGRRRQVRVELEETLGHLHHLHEQLRLYQRGILPQARQALEAELANYQTNRSDFDAWLAAQVNLYRYEREAYAALADHHKMRAELAALTGAAVAGQEDVR